MVDVNNRAIQPILRAMCAADDDRVGMSAVAHMLTAAEQLGWVLVPVEPTKPMLHAACKALSPGRRPTPERVSVAKKHAIRWQAMVAAAAIENGPSNAPSPENRDAD